MAMNKKKRGVFEDIVLKWKGNTYTIPSKRVMGAIAKIEQIVTMNELFKMTRTVDGVTPTMKMGTVAIAYAAVLRYAGADVEDEEVYGGMFDDDSGQAASLMIGAVQGLLNMMLPPSALVAAEKEFKEKEKDKKPEDDLGNDQRVPVPEGDLNSSEKPSNSVSG